MSPFLIIGLVALLLVVVISLWSVDTPTDSLAIDEVEKEKTEETVQPDIIPVEPEKTEEEIRNEPRYYGGEQGTDE